MSLSYSRRLFRTTAFRAALLYACVFSLLSAVGLGFIYWSTASHIEQQTDARLRLETDVLLNLYQARSMPALLDSIHRRSEDDSPGIFFYLLWGPDSRRLAGQLPVWPAGLDSQRAYATLSLGEVFEVNESRSEDPVRVLVTRLAGGYRLLVGRDLNDEQALLQHTFSIILAVIGVIFSLALLGSLVLGHYALRRIDTVSRTAGDIMSGDLSQRIPLSGQDNEFDELGRKLNAMLERIEQLLAGMRQVTDNVAHDLRQPLNRLRNRLEITLLEARDENEYRQVMEHGIQDADELLKTFNALLSIAQAEAGVRRNDWTQVDLHALCEDLADLYGAVAEEKGITFNWQADMLSIAGNRQLLAQALGNLLDNAIKYTPSGGHIELSATASDGSETLEVADSGPGIPLEQRERVLQRFMRLDSARSLPGNGLGLSLVKAVAKLHNAELILSDNTPGLRVRLQFTL